MEGLSRQRDQGLQTTRAHNPPMAVRRPLPTVCIDHISDDSSIQCAINAVDSVVSHRRYSLVTVREALSRIERVSEYQVATKFGEVSLIDTQGPGPVALLIHGNSACKEVFLKQLQSELIFQFRLIAIDLPGHGLSFRAENPSEIYSIPGYSSVIVDVLSLLGIEQVTIIGWSLGGHIALNLMGLTGVKGVMLVGTPPIPLSPEGFALGFPESHSTNLVSKEIFTNEEAISFVAPKGIDPNHAPFIVEAALATDGAARSCLITSVLNGYGGNQKALVECCPIPLAMVCGTEDSVINVHYINNEIAYCNLWSGKVNMIQGGHSVFWENPTTFNIIIEKFLRYLN